MNYYQELELSPSASQAEIAQHYRKLALRYHPKLCKLDQCTGYRKFCAIAEAYEVLSHGKAFMKTNAEASMINLAMML